MQDLIALYRHNAWANRKVFDVALAAGAALLEPDAGTLKHLARVEYAYLAMMEQREPEERTAYAARSLEWFSQHMDELSAGYMHLLESASDSTLARDMGIPWFDFPVSVRDGLLQVLTHSAQHRSQVLSALSSRGVPTPDLDYVLMLRAERETGA